MEATYRNPAEKVSQFLNERHKGKYKVFNVSERAIYDKAFFDGRVSDYLWPDHHAPLFKFMV